MERKSKENNSQRMQKVETEAATITFSGGCVSSSSESEPEDDIITQRHKNNGNKIERPPGIKQKKDQTNLNNNIKKLDLPSDTRPSKAISDSQCKTSNDNANQINNAQSIQTYNDSTNNQSSLCEEAICDGEKDLKNDTDNEEINDKEERHRKQMEKMRIERFNPFDREASQDDFSSEPYSPSSVSSQRDRPHSFSSSNDESGDFGRSGSTTLTLDKEINIELGLEENYFSLPDGQFGESSIAELEMAIENCKLLIRDATDHTDRKRVLVQKLVELRMKLTEAKEEPVMEDPGIKNVLGHKFREKDSRSSKYYCEMCSSVIWGMIQRWYRCEGCGFSCHDKCLNLIARTCASVKVAENPNYILSICPEKGLGTQNYKCAECRTNISYKSGSREPRHCDYTGHYYCESCHWNDTMIIPARVLHNWDLEQRKVCRASKQFMKLMLKKPVLRIQDINPMLFSFVEELNEVKKLREEILIMKKYFLSCKSALDSKLLLQLKDRQHFVENSDMYSLQDLLDVATDVLLAELAKIHSSFAQHIKTDCKICQAKGFFCEICDQHEVLFPFDNHATVCSQCSTVLHRHCLVRRKNTCPKCDRVNRRSEQTNNGLSGLEDSGQSCEIKLN